MFTTANKNLEVCVVSVGAITAVGMTASASAAAVRAGMAGFADHPFMVDKIGNPFVVAKVPTLSDEIGGQDRFIELALAAANETLRLLGRVAEGIPTISMIVGLPARRPGLPAELESRISERLIDSVRNGCHVSETQTIPKGHSAGLMAIEMGCQKIRHGRAEFCLAGGVESYLDPETLGWVEDCDQLHTTMNAWGFVPGEAAGFCLLCLPTTAERYNLPVLGRLAAVATTHEESRIKTESVCIGQGLSKAVRQIFQSLPSDIRINFTICDQNGEAYRADEYGFMLGRVSERFVDTSAFLAPADCWGDVGAASGPLFIMLAIAAAQKGYGKGSHTLLWTSSEAGERTAAIFSASVHTRGKA